MTREELIAELEVIGAKARSTIDKLVRGEAKNGITGLVCIAERAEDAARHGREASAIAMTGYGRDA